MSHLEYNLDLSPLDYYLFKSMAHLLRILCFNDLEGGSFRKGVLRFDVQNLVSARGQRTGRMVASEGATAQPLR